MKTCRLFDMIPAEELREKLSYGDTELDREFLGFEDNYFPIAEIIPHDWTIVDLCCYQAAQCYLFRNHKSYVGVDCYDRKNRGLYTPPLRFQTDNTRHYCMTIQQFLVWDLPFFDLDKTYVIASAVPDFQATDTAYHKVKHYCVVYPFEGIKVKGYEAQKIWQKLQAGTGEILDVR